MKTKQLVSLTIVACTAGVISCAHAGSGDSEQATARAIVEASGIQGGLVVHLGCGDGHLTAALRLGDGYLVHGLDVDADRLLRTRRFIRSKGAYGKVAVDSFDGRRLPYVDNLVNLLVAEDPYGVTRTEMLRVLAPGGVACVKQGRTSEVKGRNQTDNRLPLVDEWEKIVKPWPPEIDEWTHWLHGPDGNAVANDTAVEPPRHVQWVAEPRWQRHHEASPSVSAMVSSGGRLFAIINEAPVGIDGMPDRWALVARDAFNGKLLWKRPIARWGWSEWSDHSYGHGRWNHPTQIARRLVAVGDRVFVTLGFNAPLTELDAGTGRTVTTFPDTEFTDEILFQDGTLVLVVNVAAQGPGHLKEKPAIGKEVVALDSQTGKVLWRTGDFVGIASKADAIERVTHLSPAIGDGRVFCIEEDAVVALNMTTGERLWRAARSPRPRPVAYGSYYFTNLCSMVYHDGVVLFMEPDASLTRQPWNGPAKSTLLAISAETGKVLWTRESGMWGHYNQGDMFIIDGLAWVHHGESFSMMGLDPKTGEEKRTLSTQKALDQGHHHRCYRNKATSRYIVTGRRGVEFIDVASEQNLRHHWTRGTCRYGVLPCNGLLYVPPHPCVCYITSKLNGFWALSGERRAKEEGQRANEKGPFEKGPAFGTRPPSSDVRPSEDWPTYRHDATRSGCASTAVSVELRTAWSAPVGGRPSSPVIAGGRVFLTSPDTHTVWAVGADDGQTHWSFTTGGRVDTPPTIQQNLVLFGAADGWVYCLRADDGTLVWRRRAAPADRRLVDHEQLESPWPVHGNVLVQNGVAYFAAGRSSFLDGGMVVFAVDPNTGKLLKRQRIYSPDPDTGDMVECKLPYDMPPESLGALPDLFVGDGKSIYMRHLKFNPDDLSYGNAAEARPTVKNRRLHPAVGGHLMSVAGLLDGHWFSQTYWTVDGQSHSKLLVFDAHTAYGVKPFDANARHSRAIFRPGSKGYQLFANKRPGHQALWTQRVPVRIRAMVLADSTLFVAGTPDVIDPDDPWSSFDGKKGGVLWAISTADGKKLAEYDLESPPVFDGMAAAQEKLYVATADGNVVCFAGD